MKKLILLGLLVPVLLASCSSPSEESRQDQRISALETQIAELKSSASGTTTAFDKRTKCAALAPDIQTKINTLGKEYASLGKFSLGGIFYSPVKDACLWIRLTSTDAPDGSPLERRALYQYGDDFGNAEPIIGCEKILTDTHGTDTCEKWDTEIKRLK